MPITVMRKPKNPAQPAASTPQSLLSVRNAAEYYHVSQQTVRRLIKAGKLKTYRVGRQIRIDMDELVNCMSS